MSRNLLFLFATFGGVLVALHAVANSRVRVSFGGVAIAAALLLRGRRADSRPDLQFLRGPAGVLSCVCRVASRAPLVGIAGRGLWCGLCAEHHRRRPAHGCCLVHGGRRDWPAGRRGASRCVRCRLGRTDSYRFPTRRGPCSVAGRCVAPHAKAVWRGDMRRKRVFFNPVCGEAKLWK
jgi:hypothetical protein